MEYRLSRGALSQIFAVPLKVSDKYLKDATERDLKALLWFLAHPEDEYDKAAERQTGLSRADFKSGLTHWVDLEILRGPKEKTQGKGRMLETPKRLSTEEVTDISGRDPAVAFMLSECQKKLGRTISITDASVLVSLYACAGLPVDIILMVVVYCQSIGKGNIRYIERICLRFVDEGIDSHERAEHELLVMKRQDELGDTLGVALDLPRSLSLKDKAFADIWLNDWKMSLDLVKHAHEITLERTGKHSFSYMNSILTSWHGEGYKKLDDVLKNEKPKKRGKKEKHTPSFDLGKIGRDIYSTPTYEKKDG